MKDKIIKFPGETKTVLDPKSQLDVVGFIFDMVLKRINKKLITLEVKDKSNEKKFYVVNATLTIDSINEVKKWN